MLRRVNFWREESEAPLLRLNCSFLPSKEILEHISDNNDKDNEDTLATKLDHERIIRLDAERTFLGSAQRTTLMNVLSFLRNDFCSYHQAMSYVAGFLLLAHTSSKVMEIMRQLHHTVLVGYWTEEPVAFAIDAYVLTIFSPIMIEKLMNIFPKLIFFQKLMHKNGSPHYALVSCPSKHYFCFSRKLLLTPYLPLRIISYSNLL